MKELASINTMRVNSSSNAQNNHLLSSSDNRAKPAYSKTIVFLFLVFAAYLVVPIVDIPLLGLSLSAPVFFLVALYTVLRSPEPWFAHYKRWIMLAVSIWAGIFLSFTLNSLISGDLSNFTAGIINIIRYAYWLLCFVITVYFISRNGIGPKVISVLGWMIVLLALFRWGEGLLGGRVGAYSHLKIIPQNTYGILFSTFTPFLYPNLLSIKKKRLFGILAVLLVFGAALMNGSRSSWIALAGSFVVFWLIVLISTPGKFEKAFILLIISVVMLTGFYLLPGNISEAITSRFATFQNLDEDKSYAIRQLMIQKGWRLFQDLPLIGVGAGNFRMSSAELEIPDLLSYASQDYFDVKSAHNSYILFLSETGLIGVIPLGVLLIILAVQGFRAALAANRRKRFWVSAAYTSFIGMSIYLWTLAGLTSTSPWFIYGVLGAGIVIQPHTMRRLASFKR